MKKLIISAAVFVGVLSIWVTKYYSLNKGFRVWQLNPQENYAMHQKVSVGDNFNYTGGISEGYSVCIENAYLIDTKTLLSEMNIESNMSETADSSIILDIVVFNSDSDTGLQLSGMPLIGIDWSTPFSPLTTSYLNEASDNISMSGYVTVPKGESFSIRVAYDLYKGNYSPKSWNSLYKQVIWLGVSCRPLDQRIEINLDKS